IAARCAPRSTKGTCNSGLILMRSFPLLWLIPVQFNGLPSAQHREGSGLHNPDYFHTVLSPTEGNATICDTVEEVAALVLQGFADLDLGADDRAITDGELIFTVVGRLWLIGREGDTFFIDTHPLQGIQIVKDNSPVAAHHDNFANLVRFRPAYVNMADYAVWIAENHEPDIFTAVPQGARPNGADPLRQLVEEKIQDRDIMWRQIPQRIHIRADRAEVRAASIHVIHLPHIAPIDIGFHRLNACIVEEDVPDHQHEPAGLGQVEQFLGVRRVGRHWLLDQDVFTRFEALFSDFVVRCGI